MAPTPSLFSVELSRNDDGSRILSRYYRSPHPATGITPTPENPYPTAKEQANFEKALIEKIAKSTADIILYDNHIVVFKAESDVMLYVIGGLDENETLFCHVVLTLGDTLQILLR